MENKQNLTPFKIGDVVQLKSGGVKMTVRKVDLNIISVTYWDEDSKSFKNFSFEKQLLIKIEEG